MSSPAARAAAFEAARQLADAFNAVQRAGFNLAHRFDADGTLEYVVQEPGHWDGWHELAAVHWDDQEEAMVPVVFER